MDLKKKLKFKNLENILSKIFIKKNFSKKHSLTIARVLSLSEFFGIKTHGLSRLNAYLELINSNRINTRPKVKKIKDRYAVTCIDADNSFGMIAGETVKHFTNYAKSPYEDLDYNLGILSYIGDPPKDGQIAYYPESAGFKLRVK